MKPVLKILAVILLMAVSFWLGKISERSALDRLMLDNQDLSLRLIKSYDAVLEIHLQEHKLMGGK